MPSSSSISARSSMAPANKIRPCVIKPAETNLLGLRRLLDDLAANGRSIQPDLIRPATAPVFAQTALHRTIDCCATNCAAPMICRPMRCYLLVPPESASASVSIWRWTVCARSGRINGHGMSRSVSCTSNVWCRPMKTFDGSWSASWLCAFWHHPRGWRSPKACCCLDTAAITPCIRLCAGPWR